MELPFLDRIEIFWDESAQYVQFYAIYAAIIGAIVLLLEHSLQRSEIGAGPLLLSNVAQWVLSIAVVTLCMFMVAWLPDWFGGEIGAFLVALLLSLGSLYAARRLAFGALEVQLAWPNAWSAGSAALHILPFLAFMIYVFILGSADWSK